MIKFGAAAVFAGDNREPTEAELDAIIDRCRTGADGAVGALAGGKQLDAATMQASAATAHRAHDRVRAFPLFSPCDSRQLSSSRASER